MSLLKTFHDINAEEKWALNLAERKLVARALSELSYEGLISLQLVPKSESESENSHLRTYTFKHQEYIYQFQAYESVWNFKTISLESLTKTYQGKASPLSAFLFFKEIQDILELDDITLAHFIEEMHQTLFAEAHLILKNKNVTISEFANFSHLKKEAYLYGHPKILLNKGRLGFNATDFKNYSPEFEPSFSLNLILVKKNLLALTAAPSKSTIDYNQYLFEQFFSEKEILSLKTEMEKEDLSFSDYILFPVHPWQLDKIVQIQFHSELANRDIIILNDINSLLFTPQISIRTLRASNRQLPFDLKLSLNILNTSAYRGMSEEGILSGHALSHLLEKVIAADDFLKKSKMSVLKEVYGASLKQKDFKEIKEAPYRYHELLSFVLRENGTPENDHLMTGTLAHTDSLNLSYLGELIKKSGISAKEWLRLYAENIILPLYHLQLQYGIGLVAHGQNVLMTLKDSKPLSLVIKDFQGDLRLSNPYQENLLKICPEISNDPILKTVKTMPAEYLIHDLITGHFVTHLRFLSANLHLEEILSEKDFYREIALTIENYLKTYHPHLERNHPLSLLRLEFERVILNKVRFKMGYQDTAQRLLPLLGPKLKNPISASVYHE